MSTVAERHEGADFFPPYERCLREPEWPVLDSLRIIDDGPIEALAFEYLRFPIDRAQGLPVTSRFVDQYSVMTESCGLAKDTPHALTSLARFFYEQAVAVASDPDHHEGIPETHRRLRMWLGEIETYARDRCMDAQVWRYTGHLALMWGEYFAPQSATNRASV